MMGEHVSVWQRVCVFVCMCANLPGTGAGGAQSTGGPCCPRLQEIHNNLSDVVNVTAVIYGNIIQSDRCGTCQNNTTWAWERVFLWWLQRNVQYDICVFVCVCAVLCLFPVCMLVFKQKWGSRANLHNSTCASVFMNPSISLCVLIKMFPIARMSECADTSLCLRCDVFTYAYGSGIWASVCVCVVGVICSAPHT